MNARGIIERITAYLTGGGLFNPELANHDAVRDLLIDARDSLSLLASVEESEDEVVKRLSECIRSDQFGRLAGQAAALLVAQRQEIERINGIAYVMSELLGEWIATEIDPEDEEYETWMLNFTERAIAARNAYRAAYPKDTP